ncbi:MAG: amidohydrolase family protein [Gammaproteobacteria bacterium]|nr:amidohydrolase family protein [Gammaproteobacteria bacterium]MBU1600640.1 amidohydrolase family protein [Gammaproteobacteria bacterium]MBU2435096.1 amidohydrolase family protein [Gammaproteobacteria bacterium]MBU2448332.1 amidohydrolase family protein [Gammaproteobacteria bacterium]
MEQPEFAVVASDGWFDGERHVAGPVTLRVANGKIAEIGAGDHGRVMAAWGLAVHRGAFLMPGLVDAHVHLFLDGGPTDGPTRSAHMKKSVEELTAAARASARQSLDHGVTLVRDAGDKHGINHLIRDEARAATNGLCRVRSGGSGIKRAKRYGAFMAGDVGDDDSIRDSVAQLAADNDEIKIILTGIIDFDAGAVTDEPQFTLDEARLITATAKKHGRQTFAHCSGIKGLRIAANATVDAIEHGFFMDRETLAIMRDNQVAWTPTFCPVHFQWAKPEAVGWSTNTIGHLRRIIDSHAEHLRLAHEMGVTLLLGTDAGSMGVEHGKAMFEEIQRYLEAGLPLSAALQAATANNRRHFGLAPTLTVDADFEANLLAASPFLQSSALAQPPLKTWLAG